MLWLLGMVCAYLITLVRVVGDVWARYREGRRSIATALAITCVVTLIPVAFAATALEKAEPAWLREALGAVAIGLVFGGAVLGAVGLVLDRNRRKTCDRPPRDPESR